MEGVSQIKCSKALQKYQNINFLGNEGDRTAEIYSGLINIIPSSGNHSNGSSKIKLKNVVDYTWEERFYTGQLLAVHMNGVYIAYGIKGIDNSGIKGTDSSRIKAPLKSAGVVRVVNRETSQRGLIKGIEGMIEDIAFAHISKYILLACVDESGNMLIYLVEEQRQSPTLDCKLLLHITQEVEPPIAVSYRVIWCPYIPDVESNSNDDDDDDDDDDDIAQLLVLTCGTKAEIWNIGLVTAQHGVGPVKPSNVDIGYLEIEHNQPIVDASFSPDGTALATASVDGEVKFFQVHIKNVMKPRCLHNWQPHGGKPLSCLLFLDNHKNFNPEEQFWKYAITGANDNSEIKLWSCKSWTCIQTLHFSSQAEKRIKLKPCLDFSSGFLLLSDIYRKVLYVLQLDIGSNDTMAMIVSISEFLLPYPILSFGIVDAGMRKFKANSNFTLDDIIYNDEGDEENQTAVVVRMYLVQPKSMQECHIVFQPPNPEDRLSDVSLPGDSMVFRDALSDISSNIEPLSNIQELPANHTSLQLNLMTPDAFNSPVKHDSPVSSLGNLNTTVLSQPETLVTNSTSPQNLATNCDIESNVLMGFASGGSSPSREVQEILSLQESKCFFKESDLQQQPESDELTPPEEKAAPTGWSEIPMLRSSDIRKCEAENTRRSENAGQDISGDNQVWKSTQQESLSNFIHHLDSILLTIKNQTAEIKELREEIKKQSHFRELEQVLSNFAQEQNSKLEKAINSKESRQHQENMISAISQSVNNLVSTKLDDIVSNEITSSILPVVASQLEALSHKLHTEMTQKLSTTDALLKENIMKMVLSKSTMETLSSALVISLNPAIKDCFRDYFSNFVIPAFEKSCSAMFVQINDTFNKGTKDYVSTVESYSKKVNEKNRDNTAQLQSLSDIIKSSCQQLNMDINKTISNIEINVSDAVTKALRVQQVALEGTVLAAVRSRAVTPAPHIVDSQFQQHQISQLITQGQINQAFQQALSASDISLVVYVCEKVNPQQVFNQTPCPLQQPILLSLIQQLSADMMNHTELKHKYLEEAVMNLDVTNLMTKEHIPNVLKALQTQMQLYITANPNNKLIRSMKILQMATQSLLNS